MFDFIVFFSIALEKWNLGLDGFRVIDSVRH